MEFIFPQNYKFNNKLFGVFDYSTIILNVIWGLFLFCFIQLFFVNISFKISFFTILFLPVLIFSIVGFNHENIIYVFLYILKFNQNKKVYLYQ